MLLSLLYYRITAEICLGLKGRNDLSYTLPFLHSRKQLFKPNHRFQALFFSLHPSQFCTFSSLTIPMLLSIHMLLYYYIITICYYITIVIKQQQI